MVTALVTVTHRGPGRHHPSASGSEKSARVGKIPDRRDSSKNDSITRRREASHNSSFPVKSSPTITGLVAGRLSVAGVGCRGPARRQLGRGRGWLSLAELSWTVAEQERGDRVTSEETHGELTRSEETVTRAEVSERPVSTARPQLRSESDCCEDGQGAVRLCLGAGHRKRPGSEVRLLSPCWLWSQETH